jgi:hypothetical protein
VKESSEPGGTVIIPMKLVRLIKMCLSETYSKVCVCKYLADNFPIQNGLKQGDTLLLLLFNFALKYAIRIVYKNQVGLKLNGTHQLLVYADGVNLPGDNTDAIQKNMETLIDASKEVGLDVTPEKTKYMLLSRHQNAGQSYDINIANRCFENVAKLRYLGATITNQNLVQEELNLYLSSILCIKCKYTIVLNGIILYIYIVEEEITSGLNSGNACYHSVQNLLSSHLLSKNIKIRMYKTIILPFVLYGCETWSLMLREEHRLMVFEENIWSKKE